jgi:hypothetical protein
VLDEEAKQQYLERLREIKAGLEEPAEDEAVYEKLRSEQEAIYKQLRAAKGLNGRGRKLEAGNVTKGAAERVEKAMQAARKRIANRMPSLAQHLRSIKAEGTTFAYRPPAPPPDWKTAY